LTYWGSIIFNIISSILKCVIIDDTSENLPIKEAYSYLAPHIGSQEYQALAYCMNHNYQIISENNVFDMLSDTRIVNKAFTTNSIALLRELLEYKDYRKLIIELNKKNYIYLLNEGYTNNLITFMKEHNITNLSEEEKELIKIANSYGLLDKIIQYHHNKFKVQYPKKVLPIRTTLDENIEKIFDIIEIK
jgi:DNA-binding winged helix-turn-helix (wHTH) protein